MVETDSHTTVHVGTNEADTSEGTTMNTIVAFMMLLLPGMDAPRPVFREPVATYEECSARIAEALEIVRANEGREQKVLVGCQLDIKKSDPS